MLQNASRSCNIYKFEGRLSLQNARTSKVGALLKAQKAKILFLYYVSQTNFLISENVSSK